VSEGVAAGLPLALAASLLLTLAVALSLAATLALGEGDRVCDSEALGELVSLAEAVVVSPTCNNRAGAAVEAGGLALPAGSSAVRRVERFGNVRAPSGLKAAAAPTTAMESSHAAAVRALPPTGAMIRRRNKNCCAG
jgi:hypothetical protein